MSCSLILQLFTVFSKSSELHGSSINDLINLIELTSKKVIWQTLLWNSFHTSLWQKAGVDIAFRHQLIPADLLIDPSEFNVLLWHSFFFLMKEMLKKQFIFRTQVSPLHGTLGGNKNRQVDIADILTNFLTTNELPYWWLMTDLFPTSLEMLWHENNDQQRNIWAWDLGSDNFRD